MKNLFQNKKFLIIAGIVILAIAIAVPTTLYARHMKARSDASQNDTIQTDSDKSEAADDSKSEAADDSQSDNLFQTIKSGLASIGKKDKSTSDSSSKSDSKSSKKSDSKSSKKKSDSSSKSDKSAVNNSQNNSNLNTGKVTLEGQYDLAKSKEIWAYVNKERAAAGLNQLAWNDAAYSHAQTRCKQIVSNFSHFNTQGYGENILYTSGTNSSGYKMHMMWHNSSGHYNNYMNAMYDGGACAVYCANGKLYAVELFVVKANYNSPANYPPSVSETPTYDTEQQVVDSHDNGHTWTASNGTKLVLMGNGGASCYDTTKTADEQLAALKEWQDLGKPGDY